MPKIRRRKQRQVPAEPEPAKAPEPVAEPAPQRKPKRRPLSDRYVAETKLGYLLEREYGERGQRT